MQPDNELARLFSGLTPPAKPVDEAIIKAASNRLLDELSGTGPTDPSLITTLYHIVRGV